MAGDAERITRALGGDWRGHSGNAPCPVCQPEGRRDQRALSITDRGGRLLVSCHKGGCAVLPELLRRGLAEPRTDGRTPPPDRAAQEAERKRDERRMKYARQLFTEAVSCAGTPAQVYLEQVRGLVGLKFDKMIHALRFHPAALHTPSGLHLPAMVAQIRGPAGERLGVHRTYLRPDGSGKADVQPAKLMLGPASGGAVRFGPDARTIILSEGIETALSVGLAAKRTVWATLSTSGLKGLILPPKPVAEIIILAADNDDAGIRAAEQTADRLQAEGRAVSIIRPPREGQDFNDHLRGAE